MVAVKLDTAKRKFRSRWSARTPAMGLLLCFALLVILLTPGCATRTVGMQAPVAHDYDGMQWRPLDATVSQRIVVAPGYTALIENDPGTDPATLIERIREVPDDVRSAELVEIRIAVRSGDDQAFVPDLTVTTSVENSTEPAVVAGFEDLEFDGDWLIVRMLPQAGAGDIIMIEVGPAAGWEYGLTVDRIPYGGFAASIAAGDAESRSLSGSLGYETVFEQSTDRSRLLEEDAGPAVWSALTDPVLALVYVIVLGLGGTIVLARYQAKKVG